MAYNFFIYTDEDIREVKFNKDIPSHVAELAFKNKTGIEVKKIQVADNKHLCGYCHNIVNGTDEDILCNECRELFGHSLFSEL